MKIFKPLDPEIIRKPTKAVFEKLGIEIMEISYLGQGEGSGVFKIVTPNQTYCLKTALFQQRSKKVLNEAKIRNQFISYGLECVPPPFHIDQEFFKHGAVIYEFIEGSTSKLDTTGEIKQMARYLAKIHSIDYHIIPDGFEQAMKNYHTLKKTMNHIESDYPQIMNPTISEAFKHALSEYQGIIYENKDLFPFGIEGVIHGDLFNNYITDPRGKLWLIDWEHSECWDILDETCTFILDDVFSKSTRNLFIQEYKKEFPPVESLNLEKIGFHYARVMPAFNVCFGMDQMASNLQYKLDPERKLRDVIQSGHNWKKFFSKSTSKLIDDGLDELTEKLVKEYNLKI